MTDGEGTPLSAFITSAQQAEVNTIETLVENRVTEKQPQRLIYDRAADADWIRENLAAREIELICPHRRGRKKPPVQDGRPLRRYRRRFKIERHDQLAAEPQAAGCPLRIPRRPLRGLSTTGVPVYDH